MLINANKLAIFGGNKVITKQLNKYNSIGSEEIDAVINVMNSGELSKYIGAQHEDFYGGTKVKEFEKCFADYFQVDHAISVNSLTSGLIAAVGAIGIEPGDEIIVTPWTMCATATAILHWNAIPVFADIDKDTFNICPKSIEQNITPYTKAIIAVDIFGHPADMKSIRKIANKYNLKIISDSAQAPGAKYYEKYAGTLGDIGGFSLNYHKHIHTGEGGVMVTNNSDLAERLKLIRNHAEAVVSDKNTTNFSNMLGYNFRLGEIEAAIGIEQLKKLKKNIASRQHIAEMLNKKLQGLEGLKLPVVKNNCSHSYYVYAMQIDHEILQCSNKNISKALIAEGLSVTSTYQNLHLLPIYQKKIAYGSNGFPWNSSFCKRDVNYKKGICPIAENLNDYNYLGLGLCMHELPDYDVDLIAETFYKVWDNIHLIKNLDN